MQYCSVNQLTTIIFYPAINSVDFQKSAAALLMFALRTLYDLYIKFEKFLIVLCNYCANI